MKKRLLKLLLNPQVLKDKSKAQKAALCEEKSLLIKAVQEYTALRLDAINRELTNTSTLYDKPRANEYVAGLLAARKEFLQLYELVTEFSEIDIDDN